MMRALPAIVGAGLCLLVSGCGSDVSPEAYCRSFYEKAAPIREGYVQAGDTVEADPLGAFVKLMQAPGDMAVIFDGMVDHAPDDIRSDTEQVRDSFKKLQDSMGDNLDNPLKMLGANLMAGLSSAGSFERVDAYLGEHCPVDSELAQDIIDDAGS
jgi:hypothetical protein